MKTWPAHPFAFALALTCCTTVTQPAAIPEATCSADVERADLQSFPSITFGELPYVSSTLLADGVAVAWYQDGTIRLAKLDRDGAKVFESVVVENVKATFAGGIPLSLASLGSRFALEYLDPKAHAMFLKVVEGDGSPSPAAPIRLSPPTRQIGVEKVAPDVTYPYPKLRATGDFFAATWVEMLTQGSAASPFAVIQPFDGNLNARSKPIVTAVSFAEPTAADVVLDDRGVARASLDRRFFEDVVAPMFSRAKSMDRVDSGQPGDWLSVDIAFAPPVEQKVRRHASRLFPDGDGFVFIDQLQWPDAQNNTISRIELGWLDAAGALNDERRIDIPLTDAVQVAPPIVERSGPDFYVGWVSAQDAFGKSLQLHVAVIGANHDVTRRFDVDLALPNGTEAFDRMSGELQALRIDATTVTASFVWVSEADGASVPHLATHTFCR